MDIKLVEQTVENLKKRQFDAYYCATSQEARELALSLIPAGDTVAWGGSVTATQIGLIDAVKNRENIRVIDRDLAQTPEEKRALMRKGLTADTFIAGINAVSSDGWLVNIDGTGNRVAAMVFGPENVILVAGVNKITECRDEAEHRARNTAAPLNTKRFGLATPCFATGKCADCVAPNTICSQFLFTRYCKPAKRIKVILIGEELGF